MRKQRKQLLILLAVLLILAAAIPGVRYFVEKQEEKAAEAAKTEQDSKVLIDAAYEDVVKFSYDYEGGNYAFEKAEDTWHAADEPERNLKEYALQNILSGVTPLHVQQTIENVTDFSQYGLEEPQRTIAFETASASYILYVGDYNSLTGTYYISMPSESKVYIVEQTVITGFNQTYEDVTETEEESSEESGEDISSEEPVDGAASEESGEDVTSEETGEGATSEESGEDISPEEPVDGAASEESGEGATSEESGEDVTSEESGEDVSSEESGDGASSEG